MVCGINFSRFSLTKVVFLLMHIFYTLSPRPIQYYFKPSREWQSKYFCCFFFLIHTCHCLRKKRKLGLARCFSEQWVWLCKPAKLSPHEVEEETQLSSLVLWPPCAPMASAPRPLYTQWQWERGTEMWLGWLAHWRQSERFFFSTWVSPNS